MIYSHPFQVAMATQLFDRAYQRGHLRKLWSLVSRRSYRMLDLNDISPLLRVDNRFYAGIQTIPIRAIHGSIGRVRDFDREFYPLVAHNKERWVSIATAHMMDVNLPVIEVVLVDKVYYVKDGHHRISVAKAFHMVEMEAEVTLWQTSSLLASGERLVEAVEPIDPDIFKKST